MSEAPKHAMARRIQREGRYDDFLARLEELKRRGDLPPANVWKWAAREFNPVDGSPHEVDDLPKGPLPLLFGELDGAEYVDDTPESEPYVPAVDPIVEEFFLDGEEAEVSPPKTTERIPAVDPLAVPAKKRGRPKKQQPPPPPDPVDDPIHEDYSDIDREPRDAFEAEVFRRLHKKVKKEKISKPFDMIEWVSANLDEPVEDIHPLDIPSRAALSLLRTARSSAKARADFMDKHWSKIVPSKAELGNAGNSADKHATQHRMLDEFDLHFHDEVRRSQSVLEKDDDERDGSDPHSTAVNDVEAGS